MKDLASGDVIQVEGRVENLTIRSAKKIRKGLDAGKLGVTVLNAAGETEVLALAPQLQMLVVGQAVEAGKGQSGARSQSGAKAEGKGTAKAKAKTKTKAKADTAAAPASEASEAATAKPQAETPKKARGQKQAGNNAKKLSALDAAAKVLGERGTAMTCQELIQVMAEQAYWTSPGGKTPASTLYAAILRELKVKGANARFHKTERGKFSLASRED